MTEQPIGVKLSKADYTIALAANLVIAAPSDKTRQIRVLRKLDVDRCSKHSLLPEHYLLGGDCRCEQMQQARDALELLRKAEAALRRKRQRAQEWFRLC